MRMILSVSSGKEQNLQHLLKSNFAISGLREWEWLGDKGRGLGLQVKVYFHVCWTDEVKQENILPATAVTRFESGENGPFPVGTQR